MLKKRLVVHIITGLGKGGAEASLFKLATHDKKYKHVVLSLLDEGVYGPMLLAKGVEVIVLGMPRGNITFRGFLQLFRVIFALRPEVVQTWLYHADLLGGFAAKLAGVRRIVWGIRHSSLEPSANKASTLWVMRMCSWVSRWVPHAIVSCSARATEVHIAAGYKAEKFTTIPNGYDLKTYIPKPVSGSAWRSEKMFGADLPLIGCVARWDVLKDHANLLAALALVRSKHEFRCVLVGPEMDSSNAELIGLIAAHGLEDVVLPLGQTGDVPAVMNAIDLHVLASRGEAFPNVVAEALACGTPCVVTDVGDAAYIVGKYGWVVPPGDSAALAESICAALDEWGNSDWHDRKRLGRERVESLFSLDQMVAAYESVWFGSSLAMVLNGEKK